MAKKKAAEGESAGSGFNMSSSIREILSADGKLNSREVYEELGKRFPGETINRSSANVAFSNARRKLGIKGGRRRTVRMRKPTAAAGAQPKAAATRIVLDFDLLKAAKKFVSEVGSTEKAIMAVQQIASLQIG